MSPREATRRAPGTRARLLLVLAAVLSVIVPYQFWNQVWFGRRLTEQEIQTYLRDSGHPRKTQHALSQIASRMVAGDPAASAWYPQLQSLAQSPLPEIRTTVAWVMGQDNRSAPFHNALLGLLGDRDVAVRRNAALALVRFGDDAGRAELSRILLPSTIMAPGRGAVRIRLEPGQNVRKGALLARIRSAAGDGLEVRAPESGRVTAVFVRDNAPVEAGDRLVSVRSQPEEAWEALRGLYLVGQPEDLRAVEQYAGAFGDLPEDMSRQATLTAQAIRMRSVRNPIH